eukprot:TRINITY_DN5796_c2_g1_i1.p1 TRINITY_DN5796_c2_g1~~TRINITY_DN5796_c2_g1_i1.p1  ORF type:complete len:175 (+),score=39.68 TRINITY_DN5796_c2_g1_i1:336-860(+)
MRQTRCPSSSSSSCRSSSCLLSLSSSSFPYFHHSSCRGTLSSSSRGHCRCPWPGCDDGRSIFDGGCTGHVDDCWGRPSRTRSSLSSPCFQRWGVTMMMMMTEPDMRVGPGSPDFQPGGGSPGAHHHHHHHHHHQEQHHVSAGGGPAMMGMPEGATYTTSSSYSYYEGPRLYQMK